MGVPRQRTKRTIFSINPGRSGSRYLARLLQSTKEARAFHEPPPRMNGYWLERVGREGYEPSFEKRRQVKCAAISEQLDRIKPSGVYCETTHMFIKTFFDVAMHDFPHADVIILRRPLPQVLRSFVRLGYFSRRNNNWPLWMSAPSAATAALRAVDTDRNLDQFDLCIAYLLDIEARCRRFKAEYPTARVHEVELKQLNHIDRVRALFQSLSLTATDETMALVGLPVNTKKAAWYRRISTRRAPSLSHCARRLEGYLERMQRMGVDFPGIPN